jgi:hypothetical protein
LPLVPLPGCELLSLAKRLWEELARVIAFKLIAKLIRENIKCLLAVVKNKEEKLGKLA